MGGGGGKLCFFTSVLRGVLRPGLLGGGLSTSKGPLLRPFHHIGGEGEVATKGEGGGGAVGRRRSGRAGEEDEEGERRARHLSLHERKGEEGYVRI